MAKLTAKMRKALPKSSFALPNKKSNSGKGAYPVNDKAHAKAAIMDINKSNLTASQKTTVLAKARKKLGVKKGKKSPSEVLDDKADKKAGIKEKSKKDLAIDKTKGIAEDIKAAKRKKQKVV